MSFDPNKPFFPDIVFDKRKDKILITGGITFFEKVVLQQMQAIRAGEGGYTRESKDVVNKALNDAQEIVKQLTEINAKP